MDKYHYDHRPGRHRLRQVLIVLAVSLAIIGLIGSIVVRDIRGHKDKQVTGITHTIIQAGDDPGNRLRINEAGFSMELPGDWKEVGRRNDLSEHSVTWQSTKPQQDSRTVRLYIDTIPTTRSLNKLVPVTAAGNMLTVGDVSDNCATFTQGGTLNAYDATKLKEAPAKWNKVDFICDLPRVIDNEIGTGSVEGHNTVTLTGASNVPHKYFFLYTDRSGQPDNSIFTNALRSFKAR